MSTIKVDTVQSTGGNDVTLTKQSASKGWLSYDADTSNTIDNSFNLSSITDNGTGDATHTWTNAADGATYCFQITCTEDAAGAVGYVYGYNGSTACRTNRTASNHRVTVGYAANSAFADCKMYSYSWHGDLA